MNETNQEQFILFDEFNERPIAYQRIYTRLTGKVTSGLLLSQLVYWAGAMKWEEFYKIDSELLDETGMSVDELRSAKKKLKELSFVDIAVKGVPAKTYYKIDKNELILSILRLKDVKSSENMAQQPVSGNSPNLYREKAQTIYTENTQKKEFLIKNSSSSKNRLTNNIEDPDIVLVDEDGNELSPTGFVKKKKREPKNKVALRIQRKFLEMIKKEIGQDIAETSKGYFMVLQAMNKHKLTEEQILDLFDEWFALGKPDEETIHITRALSDVQINNYKVGNL